VNPWNLLPWVAVVCLSLFVIALFFAITIAMLKAVFPKKPADGQTTILTHDKPGKS
jgi:hypothetical protein